MMKQFLVLAVVLALAIAPLAVSRAGLENVSWSLSANLVIDSADYDGDGASDIAIWRPSDGLWAIRDITRVYFGQGGDIPAPADYTGDGTTDIAIFRPETGLWAIRDVGRLYFGRAGDIPVPGDYTGDGISEGAIFRPSTGLWAFQGSGERAYFGSDGDIPVPMYMGDCTDRGQKYPAIFRPSSGLWAVREVGRAYFGKSGDIPVPGNYDIDQIDQVAGKSSLDIDDAPIAIFRPSTGLWAIRDDRRTRTWLGEEGDVPVAGHYDGVELLEIAIFRESDSLWRFQDEGDDLYFGREGDIAVSGMAINPSAAIDAQGW